MYTDMMYMTYIHIYIYICMYRFITFYNRGYLTPPNPHFFNLFRNTPSLDPVGLYLFPRPSLLGGAKLTISQPERCGPLGSAPRFGRGSHTTFLLGNTNSAKAQHLRSLGCFWCFFSWKLGENLGPKWTNQRISTQRATKTRADGLYIWVYMSLKTSRVGSRNSPT